MRYGGSVRSTNFTMFSTSFAVWLTKSDADGSADLRLCGCADVRMAHEEHADLAQSRTTSDFWEGNYQRLNPRMRQAISSGLRASMSKAVRWLSSAVVARRFRTSARRTKSSFFT